MKLLTNKKAQGSNYVAVTAFLLIFGILNIIFYVILVDFTVSLDAAGLYTGTAKVVGDQFINAMRATDWMGVLLMIGLLIALGVSFFRIASSAIFFIVTLIMGIFWAFVSYFFNYVFIQMISVDKLVAAQAFFPRTLLICTNLHWVALASIIIGSITLYAKKEKGQFLT